MPRAGGYAMRRPAVLGMGSPGRVPWIRHMLLYVERSLSFDGGSSPGGCPPAGGHVCDIPCVAKPCRQNLDACQTVPTPPFLLRPPPHSHSLVAGETLPVARKTPDAVTPPGTARPLPQKPATGRAGGPTHRHAADRLFDPAYTFFAHHAPTRNPEWTRKSRDDDKEHFPENLPRLHGHARSGRQRVCLRTPV
jgi:hypothetical protein